MVGIEFFTKEDLVTYPENPVGVHLVGFDGILDMLWGKMVLALLDVDKVLLEYPYGLAELRIEPYNAIGLKGSKQVKHLYVGCIVHYFPKSFLTCFSVYSFENPITSGLSLKAKLRTGLPKNFRYLRKI